MEFFFGIFDNDPNDNLPNLVSEHTTLETCVSGHIVNKKFSAYLPYNISTIEILEERLNQYQDVITFFHFSGHQEKGLIKLNQNQTGIDKLIERLNKLPRLKFVFFNGCCTAEHLKEKLNNIPFVIGTNDNIHDKVASQYSKLLYERLFSDIGNLSDFEEINQAINHGIESTFEILSGSGDDSDNDLLTTRGGATKEAFTSTVFQIVNASQEAFESKLALVYDKNSYPVNDILKSHLGLIDSDDTFYKDYPNFIAQNLKTFVKKLSPQRKIGVERFYQTIKLVQTFMVFCKSAVASIIWTNDIKSERLALEELLTSNELPSYEIEDIDRLLNITQALVLNPNLSSEAKELVNLILCCKNFFQSIKEISGKEPNENDEDFPLFLLADKVLHNFILETQLLTKLQLHSIADIYFHNFLFSEEQNVEFGIKRFAKELSLSQAPDTAPTFTNLADLNNQAYSVQLVKEPELNGTAHIDFEHEEKAPEMIKVLNLKPFIIDWLTISNEKEETIQYCYLANITELKNARSITYKNFEDIDELEASAYTVGPRKNELNNKQRILKEHYEDFINFLTSTEDV